MIVEDGVVVILKWLSGKFNYTSQKLNGAVLKLTNAKMTLILILDALSNINTELELMVFNSKRFCACTAI